MSKLFSTLSKEELETIAPTEAEDTTDQGDGTAELEEGLEAKAEYEATADAVDAAVEELENLQEKDQMLAEAEESDDPAKQAAAVAVANEALRGACQRIGMDYEKYNVTFESLNLNADIKLAREGIGDTLKKGFEAVKKGLMAAWDFVVKYLKKFLGFFGVTFKDNEKKEEAVKKKADEVTKEAANLPADKKKAVDTLVGAATGLVPFRAKELQEVIDAVKIEPGDNKLAGPADKKLIGPANKPLLLPPPEKIKEDLSSIDDTLLNISTIKDAINQNVYWGAGNLDTIIKRISDLAHFVGKAEIKNLSNLYQVVTNKSKQLVQNMAQYKSKLQKGLDGEVGMKELLKVNTAAASNFLNFDVYENADELKSFKAKEGVLISFGLDGNSVVVLDWTSPNKITADKTIYKIAKAPFTDTVSAILSIPIARPDKQVTAISNTLLKQLDDVEAKAVEIQRGFNNIDDLNSTGQGQHKFVGVIGFTSRAFSQMASKIPYLCATLNQIHKTQLHAAEELLKAAEKIVNNSKKAA